MKRLIVLSLLQSVMAFSCPQIDPAVKDPDGMPLCPALGPDNAWDVYHCAIDQARSFHPPTKAEEASMQSLLMAHEKSVTSGVSPETTSALLMAAGQLNLQACRVNQTLDGAKDSYLLVYVKPGIKDYSGPFLMLRETNASKVMLIGPHDDSDFTFASTKIGLAQSHALVLVSDGHKRGNIPDGQAPKHGDFVHETDNLGTKTVAMLGAMYPGHTWLHIHGMSDPTKVLYRAHSDVMGTAFEASIVKHTNITDAQFAPLNAYFTVDQLVNSNFYVKTEIPVRIHANNRGIVASLSRDMEAANFGAAKAAAPLVLPPKKPVLGEKKLACISVQWTDNQVVTEVRCGNMAQSVKNFYDRNSRGAVKVKTFGGLVQMGIPDGPDKLAAGEQAALAKFPGMDYYIIPNTASKGPDHASGHIAHLNQILDTVAQHEVGHLLGLGHSSRLDDPAACCDRGSIMNPDSRGSNYLVASQYYYLGWMKDSEYTLYSQPGSFTLKQPLDPKPGTAAVIVSPVSMGHAPNGKYAFISYAPMCDSGSPCVALHLAEGGGSQLVKAIAVGSSFYDATHTGLDVAVAAGATPANVQISVNIH